MPFFEEYVQCQATKDYSSFWPKFYQEWFDLFPERLAVFPDIPGDTVLSEAQLQLVADAVANRKKVRS